MDPIKTINGVFSALFALLYLMGKYHVTKNVTSRFLGAVWT
jgi:hypothetical protein